MIEKISLYIFSGSYFYLTPKKSYPILILNLLEYFLILGMPKKIQIVINEDFDFLEKLLTKTSGSLKKDRVKTLILIKKGKYVYYSDIAKKLGRTEKTVRVWGQDYLKNDISEMLCVRSGGNNTKQISDKMAKSVEQKLTDSKTLI
ncbi:MULTISPECIES: COG3415 family protein [Flavobacterium]|uniref:Helix-turn-helix domain-containing protein n=1 Tax=Flavobacterium covae TaxID=2906076 RepID=A0ABW8PFZ8_9FLAO|nr:MULTISPECIES: helix-turn-helix domain-containing protein [Flavobacterium]